MKQVKAQTKKLQLTKETLKNLQNAELAQIAGGDSGDGCSNQSIIIVDCLTITQQPSDPC